MPRILVPIALLIAAAAPSRTATAGGGAVGIGVSLAAPPPPAAPAPAVAVPTDVAPAAAEQPGHEVLLGSAQLALGAAADVGTFAAIFATDLAPKNIGIRNEYGSLLYVGSLVPAVTGGVVCGLGHLSNSYRGRCWTTILGAYAGATLGVVLGILMAPSPGPDDTSTFMQSMAALAGMALLTPIGAVVGYHAGKREIPRERAASAPAAPLDAGRMFATAASDPRRGSFADVPARRTMLTLVHFSW